jgi:hypothetical protein
MSDDMFQMMQKVDLGIWHYWLALAQAPSDMNEALAKRWVVRKGIGLVLTVAGRVALRDEQVRREVGGGR